MDAILFIVSFAFTITYYLRLQSYLESMKQRLPRLFAELGSPSIFTKKSKYSSLFGFFITKKSKSFPLFGFFISGEFRRLEDAELVTMGTRLVVHFFAMLICLISFLTYMITSSGS